MEEIQHKNTKQKQYFPIQSIHTFEQNVPRLLSGNRKIKSPVKSIRGKINQLMINVTLSKNFDKKQFKIISSIPPDQWIKSQRQLMQKICCDKTLYEQSFSLFYKNHHTIANWCQLATEQNSQIEPYVFKQLLLHKKSQYAIYQSFNNERVKDSISIIRKKTIDKKYILASHNKNLKNSNLVQGSLIENDSNFNNGQSENASFIKPSLSPKFCRQKRYDSSQQPSTQQSPPIISYKKHQVMSIFFNNSTIKMETKQRKRKPLNLQRFKHTKKQSHDPHEFYMKTFDACNGWNYIFYDYERHMKGYGEKGKYNKFVRGSKGQEWGEGRYRPPMMRGGGDSSRQMKRFAEFEEFKASQSRQNKCSLLPINMVLNERQLNNYQGLKRIVSENKSRKVVFINHQGKPITYYIKKDQQMCGYNLSQQTKSILRKSVCMTQQIKPTLSSHQVNNLNTLR